MRKVFAALAMLGLAVSLAAPLRAESLDGTMWKVSHKTGFKGCMQKMHMWPRGMMKFDGGKVIKGKKGNPAAYTTAQENGKTTWKADMTTPKGAKVIMTGAVDGDSMTGSNTWTDAKGKTKTYEWKAVKCHCSKKDKPAAGK